MSNRQRKIIFLILGIILFLLVLITLLFLMFRPVDVKDVQITNLTANGFSISWYSQDDDSSAVYYRQKDQGSWSLMPVLDQLRSDKNYDDRDVDFDENFEWTLKEAGSRNRKSHHVSISGLEPETAYEFRIGNWFLLKSQDINGQDFPTVTTHKVIDDLSTPDPLYGMLNFEGSLDGVVYLQIVDINTQEPLGEMMSTVISNNNSYSIDIANIRNNAGDASLGKEDMENGVFDLQILSQADDRSVSFKFDTDKYKPMPTIIVQDIPNQSLVFKAHAIVTDIDDDTSTPEPQEDTPDDQIGPGKGEKCNPVSPFCDTGLYCVSCGGDLSICLENPAGGGCPTNDDVEAPPVVLCAGGYCQKGDNCYDCPDPYSDECISFTYPASPAGSYPYFCMDNSVNCDLVTVVDDNVCKQCSQYSYCSENQIDSIPDESEFGLPGEGSVPSNNSNTLPDDLIVNSQDSARPEGSALEIDQAIRDMHSMARDLCDFYGIVYEYDGNGNYNVSQLENTGSYPKCTQTDSCQKDGRIYVLYDSGYWYDEATYDPGGSYIFPCPGDAELIPLSKKKNVTGCYEDSNVCPDGQECIYCQGAFSNYARNFICVNPNDAIPCYSSLCGDLQCQDQWENNENCPGDCRNTSSKMDYIDIALAAKDKLIANASGNYVVYVGDDFEAPLGEVAVNLDGADKAEIRLFVDTNANGKKDKDETFLEDYSQISLKKDAEVAKYDLNVGWNLIAIPLLSNEGIATASELLDHFNNQGANIKHIAKYTDAGFVMYTKREGDIEFSNDFNIVPGQGYFILNYTAKEVKLKGNKFDEAVPFRVQNGWNLVGVYTNEKPYTAEELIKDMVAEGIVTDTVGRFDSGLYTSVVYEDDLLYGNDYNLFERQGYFIRVKEGGGADVKFTPTPE